MDLKNRQNLPHRTEHKRQPMLLLGLAVVAFIFSMYLVSATYTLTASSNESNGSTWYKGGTNRTFAFTILATNVNATSNLTQINITNLNSTLYSPTTNVTVAASNWSIWACTANSTANKVNCTGQSGTPGNVSSFAIKITLVAMLPSLSTQMNQTWNISTSDNYSSINSTSWNTEVDSVAPVINLSYTNATKYKNTQSITLNISLADAGSGLTGTACKININGTNQTIPVSNGWCNTTSGNLSNLADGNQTINVYANDTVNNIGLNNSYVVWIDTTPPSITLNNPIDTYNSSSSSNIFSANLSSAIAISYSILYGNFSGAWTVNSTNTSVANGTQVNFTVALPDGYYKWNYWANDSLGNSGFSAANRTLTVDTTGPTVTLPLYTNATLYNNTDNLTFNISLADAGVGPSYCSINVGGGTNQTLAVSSGWCNGSYNLTGLADGNQTIYAYANDTLGNTALNDSYVAQISTTSAGGAGSNKTTKDTGGSSGYFTNTVSDSDLENGYTTELGVNIQLSVNIGSESHLIRVYSITSSTATLKISSNPVLITLSPGQNASVDVNKDGFNDLSVLLNSIGNNRANFTIQKIHTPAATGAQQNMATGASLTWLWILIIIALFLLAFFLAERGRNRKR